MKPSIATFPWEYAPMVLFLAMIGMAAVFTPHFLEWQTLRNTLVQVFPMMLAALGMTLVISSGGIDISVGSVMAIAAAVSASVHLSGMGVPGALACGIVAAGLCGLFNGFLICRFRIQPIIVTLVVMIAGRGVAVRIQGEVSTSLMKTALHDFGSYEVFDLVPVQIVIMAVATAVMLFVVSKTVFAKHVEAVGENARAARLVGIPIAFTTIGVYVVCGLLCGIAGGMEAARIGSVNVGTLGHLVELDAIAAVAIGGTPFSGGRARVAGTVVGAVIVGLVEVIVNMNNIPFYYSLALKALIVVVAMASQQGRRKGTT